MDFDGLGILDINGVARLPLAGDLDAVGLADRMVQESIPYFECHKCGRFDYCKFVQRSPDNPDRAIDIKCGVAESSLRHYVERTFPLLASLGMQRRQDYLDAAFHFVRFVLNAEIGIAQYMNSDFVEYWSGAGPLFFGRIVGLRDNLDRLAEKMFSIPEFQSGQPVLFVEGDSEKAFLSKLREGLMAWFLDLPVEVYGGTGNLRRIELLLQNFQRQGYRVFMEGDADGHQQEHFKRIIRKGLIASEHTFEFSCDFETSIPRGLLFSALRRTGELKTVGREEFCAALAQLPGPVGKALLTRYSIDLDPLKVQLATNVAEAMNHFERPWWIDEEFMETELGQFLRFIQRIL